MHIHALLRISVQDKRIELVDTKGFDSVLRGCGSSAKFFCCAFKWSSSCIALLQYLSLYRLTYFEWCFSCSYQAIIQNLIFIVGGQFKVFYFDAQCSLDCLITWIHIYLRNSSCRGIQLSQWTVITTTNSSLRAHLLNMLPIPRSPEASWSICLLWKKPWSACNIIIWYMNEKSRLSGLFTYNSTYTSK